MRQTIYFFCFLYILFVPIELYLFQVQETITSGVFTGAIIFVAHTLFGEPIIQAGVSSDSIAMYVLLLLLLIIAIILTILTRAIKTLRQKWDSIDQFLTILFCYYLALELFKYGSDKFFKAQFYLPEPNTLYTPLGFISRDLLYWSTMGSSYSYSVFLGLVEIFAALLLLFQRTRMVGLLVAAALLLNIVAVNFSFDISVKIHSCFLLFLTLVLLWPQGRTLYTFFIKKEPAQLRLQTDQVLKSKPLRTALKTFACCVILFEAGYPALKRVLFYDNLAARPLFHGAYQVIHAETDSIQTPAIKRFFIHRDGYLIFQNEKDEMKDYKLFVDTINKQFLVFDDRRKLTKVHYEYIASDSLLTLQFVKNNRHVLLKGKTLEWRSLPALRQQFHWTVEGAF